MRPPADGRATPCASDPAQVVEVAAKGAYVVGGMVRVIGYDQMVIGLSRALRFCF